MECRALLMVCRALSRLNTIPGSLHTTHGSFDDKGRFDRI